MQAGGRINHHITGGEFDALFADSIAGALIMLCLTGMLLWTKLHGTRIAAMLLFSGAIITGVIVTLPSLMAYSL
ncbi:hypothetical protein [Paremcibacter congregatus]|uniref:hypothetical protein n=1 Tax=Paremcibacter congregatus TaxID=2043170 RepID=UPI001056A02F|nr:hypothetical protein [Paremcibacter congregatus]QDE25815.1 hypothetical protein FIV45_00245 [Paremcibacter congregatus]